MHEGHHEQHAEEARRPPAIAARVGKHRQRPEQEQPPAEGSATGAWAQPHSVVKTRATQWIVVAAAPVAVMNIPPSVVSTVTAKAQVSAAVSA
jgi:hypothetical protein